MIDFLLIYLKLYWLAGRIYFAMGAAYLLLEKAARPLFFLLFQKSDRWWESDFWCYPPPVTGLLIKMLGLATACRSS